MEGKEKTVLATSRREMLLTVLIGIAREEKDSSNDITATKTAERRTMVLIVEKKQRRGVEAVEMITEGIEEER